MECHWVPEKPKDSLGYSGPQTECCCSSWQAVCTGPGGAGTVDGEVLEAAEHLEKVPQWFLQMFARSGLPFLWEGGLFIVSYVWLLGLWILTSLFYSI